jgi:hypothetical protein
MFDNMGSGEGHITVQDVVFRYLLMFGDLLKGGGFTPGGPMGESDREERAYHLVEALFAITSVFMDPRDIREYHAKVIPFQQKYQKIRTNQKHLVAESSKKIKNLYIRLAIDRLCIIISALGRKGIIKEHAAAAVAGEHLVQVIGGQVVDDGDTDTEDDLLTAPGPIEEEPEEKPATLEPLPINPQPTTYQVEEETLTPSSHPPEKKRPGPRRKKPDVDEGIVMPRSTFPSNLPPGPTPRPIHPILRGSTPPPMDESEVEWTDEE